MNSIGIIETQGFTAITAAADAATKAANVVLVAREKLGGGYIAIILEGDIAAVETAVAVGREVTESFNALIGTEVNSRPSKGVGRLFATCALRGGNSKYTGLTGGKSLFQLRRPDRPLVWQMTYRNHTIHPFS